MIESNKPFAIMEIYSGLPSHIEGVEHSYEILTICNEKVRYSKLTDAEFKDLRSKRSSIKMVSSTPDGRVLEFNNFKQSVDKLKRKKKFLLNTTSCNKINNALNIEIDELAELD
jgi:hypothetical protein